VNALDVALVVLLGWSTYKGWKTGLLQALLGLVGLVVAYVFALAYGQGIGHSLFGDDSSSLTGILGIIIVFFGVALGFYVGARFVKAFLHATPLGIFDAAAGGVLGLGQGVLGFGLLILLAYSYPLHTKIPEQIESSRLAEPVQTGALILVDGIKAILPSVKSVLDDLNIRGSNEHPPVVETIKAGADDAREKLEGVVEESRKRLKDVVK
jgi:membrane protein required for colicin V production